MTCFIKRVLLFCFIAVEEDQRHTIVPPHLTSHSTLNRAPSPLARPAARVDTNAHCESLYPTTAAIEYTS